MPENPEWQSTPEQILKAHSFPFPIASGQDSSLLDSVSAEDQQMQCQSRKFHESNGITCGKIMFGRNPNFSSEKQDLVKTSSAKFSSQNRRTVIILKNI